jgi:hypothetical protein
MRLSNEMRYAIATWFHPDLERCEATWDKNAKYLYPTSIVGEMDILVAYQAMYEGSDEPILAYIHDDVLITEKDWDLRVLKEFGNPSVGLVGFGGGLGHGNPQLYKIPYSPDQLYRIHFMSNLRNAEEHGRRFTGEHDVAILDGFAIFVRKELLDKAGGWPQNTPIGYCGYDYWICCMARRLGYRIRLVGVACDHLGGRSVGLNPNLKADAKAVDRIIYDEFRDVLPAMVEE